MKNVIKRYTHNFTWSSVEAIIFQSLLLIHQSILFKCISGELYGLMGTIFGLIYFSVKVLDGGLSKALITYYQSLSLNRQSFISFFIEQLALNVIFYFFVVCILYGVYTASNTCIFHVICIDTRILILSLLLIVIESAKTVLKRLLQLSHRFRRVAFCEITFIISYLIAVWSCYFYTGSLNLYVILGLCSLMSLCEVIGLMIMTYYWYLSLPINHTTSHNSNTLTSYTLTNSVITRLSLYGHSISKQFFSGNVLIPLFAYSYGFEYAAVLKLASYATHSITTIIERIIDPSISVLFAHTQHESTENKQKVFSLALNISCHIVLCVFIFITINITKLFTLSSITPTIAPYVIIYFLIHYCENIFIAVERYYISHNRSGFLIGGTLFNIIIGFILFMNCVSPLLALIFFLISRIVIHIVLIYFLSYIWGIQSYVRIVPRYIIASLIVSLLCKAML